MTGDIERYRAIIAALEAECAAKDEVIRAIRDAAIVPRPAVMAAGEFTIEEHRRRQYEFGYLQRDRAICVQGAAAWALGEGRSESPYLAEAESILVAATNLRDQCAEPLKYPVSQEEGGA